MEESAKGTVIIVHGTWAEPKPGVIRWYQPGDGATAAGEFVSKLDAALQKRGSPARCWAHCTQADQIFHWSGENSWIARTQAASELGNYVTKLRNDGWCCHIVAHSHGGNVVLEALPQITTALLSKASLGEIVTLGTPFMDTMSPILKRIRRTERFLVGLSWIALGWFILMPVIIWALIGFAGFRDLVAVLATISTFLVPVIVFALLVFSRKNQIEPVLNTATQMQPKFLAIGSVMDEPWQLLHYMRDAPNPMTVETNLIRYLASSMRSQISQSHEVARIYGAKSYRDLKLKAKLFLAGMHVMFFSSVSLSRFVDYFRDDLFYDSSEDPSPGSGRWTCFCCLPTLWVYIWGLLLGGSY